MSKEKTLYDLQKALRAIAQDYFKKNGRKVWLFGSKIKIKGGVA